MLVGGNLTLLGVRVIPFEAEVGNVVFRGKATGVTGVVPFDIYASVQITLLVLSDVLVLFEGISKFMGMAVADIFNTKVVDDEAKEGSTPCVATNTGSGGALVVSMLG